MLITFFADVAAVAAGKTSAWPEIGSWPDWIGGVGGALGAGTAATFYFLDRKRANLAETQQSKRSKWKRQKIVEEAQHQLDDADRVIKDAAKVFDGGGENSLITHRQEAVVKLRAAQRRLNELKTLAVEDPRLFSLIGQSADMLLFLDFPPSGHRAWIVEAKRAANLIGLMKERLNFFTY